MKITPEEFILMHGTQLYDPAKRREYYLKTRELKGRLGGGVSAPTSRPLTKAVQRTGKRVTTSNREEIQRRREEVQNRVAALNVKLDKLRGILQGLDDQTNKGEKKSEDKGKEKKKEPTAAEKKKAAKEAKERRDKEVKKSPVQAVADLQEKIEAVKEQIREARIKLEQKAARKAANQGSETPKVSSKPKSRKE